MTLYRNKYRIESARYKGWEYFSKGNYFITLCTKNRKCLFGNVVQGKMILSEMGKIVEQYWWQIQNLNENVKLDAFVVMPNHIHGIITILERPKLGVSTPSSGSPSSGSPSSGSSSSVSSSVTVKTPNLGVFTSPQTPHKKPHIGIIINQYKRICTMHFRKLNPEIKIWQPRYHDRIIRDEKELFHVRQYIINNPLNWKPKNLFF